MSDSDEGGALLVQQCSDSTAVDANEANNNAVESFEAKSVLKGKRERSTVWKYFIFKGNKVKGPNKKKVFCKLCEKTVKKGKMMMGISYTGGTTNLTNHLKIWHKSEYNKSIEESNEKNKSKSIKDFLVKRLKM